MATSAGDPTWCSPLPEGCIWSLDQERKSATNALKTQQGKVTACMSTMYKWCNITQMGSAVWETPRSKQSYAFQEGLTCEELKMTRNSIDRQRDLLWQLDTLDFEQKTVASLLKRWSFGQYLTIMSDISQDSCDPCDPKLRRVSPRWPMRLHARRWMMRYMQALAPPSALRSKVIKNLSNHSSCHMLSHVVTCCHMLSRWIRCWKNIKPLKRVDVGRRFELETWMNLNEP